MPALTSANNPIPADGTYTLRTDPGAWYSLAFASTAFPSIALQWLSEEGLATAFPESPRVTSGVFRFFAPSKQIQLVVTDWTSPVEVLLNKSADGENTTAAILEACGPAPLPGTLSKTDRLTPAFEVSVAGTIQTSQTIVISLPSGAVITLPAATSAPLDTGSFADGTDYAIHCLANGSLVSSASFTSPAGGLLIGGFHYAPGSNAYIPENNATFYGDGPALIRSGNFQISTGNFYFRVPAGAITYRAAATLTLSAGVVPANTWALYRFGINAAGDITVYPAAANATTGYATEALALAAMPPITAGERSIGYTTVRAAAAATFTPGADALLGGTGGTVAQDTRYYSESSMGASINPYSIWDQNFRPTCPDPRGMALVAGKFWIDIYLTNNRPDLYGTSSYDRTAADGSSRAARPVSIGGKTDGSLLMPTHSWWDSDLLAGAYGKTLPTLDELHEATLGATQAVTTIWDRGVTSYYGALTSMYGLVQSFGLLWVWATDAGSDNDKKALFGGPWNDSGSAGSRYVNWLYPAMTPYSPLIGSRFRSDHLIA